MKRLFCSLLVCFLLIPSAFASADKKPLQEYLLESYYLDANDPAAKYLQNKSIERFWTMWVASYFDDEEMEVTWDYDTLAPVQVLDHNFESIVRKHDPLYTCIFTTADGKSGYLIISYNDEDPSVSQWSLHETTPYYYDLRANLEAIEAALQTTDIDLATVIATRVEWIDTEKNRGDRIILFEDGKGDRYICYLGDDDFSLEKM